MRTWLLKIKWDSEKKCNKIYKCISTIVQSEFVPLIPLILSGLPFSFHYLLEVRGNRKITPSLRGIEKRDYWWSTLWIQPLPWFFPFDDLLPFYIPEMTNWMTTIMLFSHKVLPNSATPWTAACQDSLSFTISEFAQIHVHWVSDTIRLSHPLTSILLLL